MLTLLIAHPYAVIFFFISFFGLFFFYLPYLDRKEDARKQREKAEFIAAFRRYEENKPSIFN